MITKNHVLITVVAITIVIVLVSGYSLRKLKIYNETLKKTYSDRIQIIERELERSRRSRDSISNIVLNLQRDLADLERLDSIKSIEADKVSGSFDKLTSSELQSKMLEEHKKFTK